MDFATGNNNNQHYGEAAAEASILDSLVQQHLKLVFMAQLLNVTFAGCTVYASRI